MYSLLNIEIIKCNEFLFNLFLNNSIKICVNWLKKQKLYLVLVLRVFLLKVSFDLFQFAWKKEKV